MHPLPTLRAMQFRWRHSNPRDDGHVGQQMQTGNVTNRSRLLSPLRLSYVYSCPCIPPERYTAGLSCFDTELQSFVRFPHAEAFAKPASHMGGMWYGLRMTGHAAVPCSRGLMFIGGLVPRGHSTMSAWVLDVVGGRQCIAKKRRRRRARALAAAGGCGQS